MFDALSHPDAPTMNDDDVLAFLRSNPKFLEKNPEAVEYLTLPKSGKKSGVADFQGYMIDRLKADKTEAEQLTRDIVASSRANMNNQARVHAAVLRLLEANSFDDFIQCVTMDLAQMLDVDIATFVVETDGSEIPHVHSSGIRLIPEGTVDKWMADKAVLLQDDIAGIEAIYGGGATLVRSQILLRIDISMGTPPAILAFGSRTPDMFQDGQATDQVLFLARVIERCFRTWLNLPV